MASIVKDPRRGTYLIQWYDGRRWRRATVHKVPGWKPGKSAFPARDPTPVTAALAEYQARERDARRGRVPADPAATIAEFLADYRAAYARDRAAGSLRVLDRTIRVFRDWCDSAKVAKLDAATPAACQKFLDWRAAGVSKATGRPITPRRLSVERAMLAGAWSRAAKLGVLPANPWTPTQAPGWDKARRARVKKPSWTPEEFARLMAAANPWLRDVLTLGTQTGIRISALLALEWRDVHRPGDGDGPGEVQVRPELDKAGGGYKVPISAVARAMLARRRAGRTPGVPQVLAGQGGRRIRVSTSARAIIAACRRAGLPVPISPNHHMRRTFGRWAVIGHLTGRPIPLYVVSKWLGHASVKMTEEYLSITPDEGQDWMAECRSPGTGDAPAAHTPDRGDQPPAPADPDPPPTPTPTPTRNDSSGQDPDS